MKVLYVTGSCLKKNTSANMSHNGFVKGLIDNDADVDIIMANDSWGESDAALPRWPNAQYHTFNSVSFADKLRNSYKKNEISCHPATFAETSESEIKTTSNSSLKTKLRSILKRIFYVLFPQDPLYPLNKMWLKEAKSFKCNTVYDLVVSNSSPSAGHKLVAELLKSKHIVCKRWIQIWEDPWYFDLYGGHSEKIKEEEHKLLQVAQEIVYVSPLTLMYQKKFYPDCAEKMSCVPLPYFIYTNDKTDDSTLTEFSFGYFGDYFAKSRNLLPFYEALKISGHKGYIYGDSDVNLESTNEIEVSGRVTLDKLAAIQEKTAVLVHLCNLRGGQIPGKIYHYSATTKPILFILDGTVEEIDCLRNYFEQFNRYYFCDNTVESILNTIQLIKNEKKSFNPIDEFSPKQVIKKLLEG